MTKQEFDYYIFIDYSENILGYLVIDSTKIRELMPYISRFGHYNELRYKSSYLHSIKKIIEKNQIKTYFLKLKIRQVRETPEIYSDILLFLKDHNNCLIFISVDNKQYSNFEKLVNIINGQNIKVVKESELKIGSKEYKISLVLDTLLNIERLKYKNV